MSEFIKKAIQRCPKIKKAFDSFRLEASKLLKRDDQTEIVVERGPRNYGDGDHWLIYKGKPYPVWVVILGGVVGFILGFFI